MSLSFDLEGEFFEECKLAQKIHLVGRVALKGGARVVEEGALHLCVAAAVDLISIIHFL